jgi:hypothetical protein
MTVHPRLPADHLRERAGLCQGRKNDKPMAVARTLGFDIADLQEARALLEEVS